MTQPGQSYSEMTDAISIKQLPTGYWHIRGHGGCNWTQPPRWPCDEATIRASAFPEASESFLREVVRLAESAPTSEEGER